MNNSPTIKKECICPVHIKCEHSRGHCQPSEEKECGYWGKPPIKISQEKRCQQHGKMIGEDACFTYRSQPSKEKDQYGHKIIRPTLPDDTFAGLKEEIKERAKQEEWEEKIYDLLSTTEPLGKGFKVVETDAGTANEIIDLIRQLLKKEREKVIEEVKKNTKDLTKYETEFTCPCGQEHSVQFLIRKPKVMKGKITEITINSQQLKK